MSSTFTYDSITPLETVTDVISENGSRQSHILETLAAAVYTCDANGYITFYNKAAAELWGREPAIGKDLWCGSWKIYEPDSITPLSFDMCPMSVALKEARPVRGREIVVERPDGVKRHIMPHPDPIFDSSGALVAAVNLLVDITHLKQKENDLRESEEKYKKLTEELQAALKTEEEFISIASHELKTPVTCINVFLQLLLKMYPVGNGNSTHYMLERSKAQLDRLISLIKELLDVTKLRAGKLDLNFEKVSINNILDDVIHEHSSTIPTHAVIKQGHTDSIIRCDKGRIEQVISNLLTNAAKYSPDSDKIVVTIGEDDTNVQVSIQDFGIGIAPENLLKVFERFFRAQYTDGQILSSLGLGLYISADIIARHNGKIWVDSEVGKGSVFHFSLPKS